MEGGASGGTHKASESAVRHVLLRLAECGDSFGHNQTWGGPPDPPLTRAQPHGSDLGGPVGRGTRAGSPAGEGPPPPFVCPFITRANKRTRRSIHTALCEPF